MTAPTAQLLGDLVTEYAADEPPYDLEAPPQTMYRPAGVPLINDGSWRYWMMPGSAYNLDHDGTGWRVTCQTWPTGHTYRLADQDGSFVGSLPLAGGELLLDPQCGYELREARRHHWAVYQSHR